MSGREPTAREIIASAFDWVGSGPVSPESDGVSPFRDRPGTHRSVNSGDQWKFAFANGYGASVIRHANSYGVDAGLWELAVIGRNGGLAYDTPITSDVIGWLNEAAVADTLDRIEAL